MDREQLCTQEWGLREFSDATATASEVSRAIIAAQPQDWRARWNRERGLGGRPFHRRRGKHLRLDLTQAYHARSIPRYGTHRLLARGIQIAPADQPRVHDLEGLLAHLVVQRRGLQHGSAQGRPGRSGDARGFRTVFQCAEWIHCLRGGREGYRMAIAHVHLSNLLCQGVGQRQTVDHTEIESPPRGWWRRISEICEAAALFSLMLDGRHRRSIRPMALGPKAGIFFEPLGLQVGDAGCRRCGEAGVVAIEPWRMFGRTRSDVPRVGRRHIVVRRKRHLSQPHHRCVALRCMGPKVCVGVHGERPRDRRHAAGHHHGRPATPALRGPMRMYQGVGRLCAARRRPRRRKFVASTWAGHHRKTALASQRLLAKEEIQTLFT